jgi:hypothetical protein
MRYNTNTGETVKIRIALCVTKGDVEMGGDKGMSLFQIYYLHIPIHPKSPPFYTFCFVFILEKYSLLIHGCRAEYM